MIVLSTGNTRARARTGERRWGGRRGRAHVQVQAQGRCEPGGGVTCAASRAATGTGTRASAAVRPVSPVEGWRAHQAAGTGTSALCGR
eukprot:2146144-Prymnesium_polylepis.1